MFIMEDRAYLNLALKKTLRFDQQKSLVTDQKNSTNQNVLKKNQ